jgi:alkylation response protein AidB-like acyl-CoA dehydrogenase
MGRNRGALPPRVIFGLDFEGRIRTMERPPDSRTISMPFAFTPAEEAFRAEVRQFFRTEYPQQIIAKLAAGQRLDKVDHIASQQALNAKGWLGVGWPKEHGGTGWTPVERFIFDYELDQAGAAPIIPMAVIYVGPIICAFGSEEQKRTWLPGILESRDFWAQGYSEPEAGSDLASLRFSAVRDGDDYVLNGTKIWTSGAHHADWIFCLCRTSTEARKQQGISMICARLDSPGVRVVPIRLIDGSHELNRIEFDNVRVPVSNRIGEEGQAWHYSNVLLKTERLSYAHIGAKRRDIAAVRAQAASVPAGGGRMMGDEPAFARAVCAAEARLDAIEVSILQALRGEISMARAAALKIACTECAQAITELFVQLAGRWRAPMLDRHRADWAQGAPQVPAFGPRRVQPYLFERAQTIYGGATEIQKNIIWKSLGQRAEGIEGLSEEQAMLRQSLAASYAREYPFQVRQSALSQDAPGPIWPVLVRTLGLGADAIGLTEEMLAREAAGRGLLLDPLGETLVAARLLRAAGGPAAQRLLGRVSQGAPVVLAWSEAGMREDFADVATTARREGGEWVLEGAKALVVGAPLCDEVIVAVRTGAGLTLFALPTRHPGVTRHGYRTIDGRPAADIVLEAVCLPDDARVGEDGAALALLEAARDHALVLQAAEAGALLAEMVGQTLAYLQQRRQFGQPLADFQALQHAVVDMYIEAELVTAAAMAAANAFDQDAATRARACSAAQATVARACRMIGQKAIQLHGGMGMTDELAIGHHARRALVIEAIWGDGDWHLDRCARMQAVGQGQTPFG